MKQQMPKKHAGIWLDNAKAIIISKGPENEEYTVQDQVKANESHGGGSEHSINNARQSDMLKYFKNVSGLLAAYDEILIFGPGQSQEQLQHHLQDDNRFKSIQITIDSADHLTDPQIIAKVRDFFKSHQS